MKEFGSRIYEHLITKRKYNKLQIKLDVKTEEYDKKVVFLYKMFGWERYGYYG